MDDLTERFQGLDHLEMPDVWTDASSRDPSRPTPPATPHRLAIALFAFGLAALAIGFAVIALRGSDERTRIGNSPEGLVPSGGTYSLSRFEVEFPVELRPGETGPVANVAVSWEWTSETFPGEAPCTIRLLDEADTVILVHETAFTALERTGRTGRLFRIPVSEGNPVSAQGECGPGMIFDGRSVYVFSDLRVEPNGLFADISWSKDTPVGHAACAILITLPSGEDRIHTFTLYVGRSRVDDHDLLSGPFPVGATAQVRCEPYRVPEQVNKSNWLPWTDVPAEATESIAPSPTEAPSVVRITCTGSDEALLESSAVEVQRDGVHFEVRNPGDAEFIYIRDPVDLGQSIGFDVGPGTSTRVIGMMQMRVAEWLVGCFSGPFSTFEHGAADYERLEIVDPEAVWVSTEMECDRTPEDDFTDGSVDLDGVAPEDVAAALRTRMPGLRDGDVVEAAGYPEAEWQTYRAVRDGHVIARFEFLDHSSPRSSAHYETCRGSGVGGA